MKDAKVYEARARGGCQAAVDNNLLLAQYMLVEQLPIFGRMGGNGITPGGFQYSMALSLCE